MWSWSWAYEVILSKGHNNLTKLNEKTSCICGKAFQTCNSYGFGWELHNTEELYFIIIFLKRNTPDIKHHVGEDHSNSFQPYHNPQQPRIKFCFLLPTSFKLKGWTFSHQIQNWAVHKVVTRHKKEINRATIHHLNKEKLHMLTTHIGKKVNIFGVL